MDQKIINLYDRFTHGGMNRREFLDRLSVLAGSAAAAAALLLHYAETDEAVNAGIAVYEAALKANNKTYTLYTYPGTQHAFNNDTAGARYNKAAADLAWSRTLAFFAENLGAPPKAA